MEEAAAGAEAVEQGEVPPQTAASQPEDSFGYAGSSECISASSQHLSIASVAARHIRRRSHVYSSLPVAMRRDSSTILRDLFVDTSARFT